MGTSNSHAALGSRVRRRPRAVLGVDRLEDRLAPAAALVKNIVPNNGSLVASDLTSSNGNLFFVANDGTNGSELWKSDGTAAGTVMVKNIHRDTSGYFYPSELTDVNGTLFFSANDGTHSWELWKSNGTAAGTVMVKDYPKWGAGPSDLTNVNGTLFYVARDPKNGVELFKSNGTAAGTVMVKNIHPDKGGYVYLSDLTNVNGTLFFTANDGTNGIELWKSDGTRDGTVMVRNISPVDGSSNPRYLTNVNGTLYFQANDGTNGTELWKSDGSHDGTVMVKNINALPGPTNSDPKGLINVNGLVYFRANDGVNGTELWKSDGSPNGTAMVENNDPSTAADTDTLTGAVVNGILYYVGDDGTNGNELWRSDGSTGGTFMLKNIRATGNSNPFDLTDVDGTLYFTADDGTRGRELWKSDGTPDGTAITEDLLAGSGSGVPFFSGLTYVDTTLYFIGDNGTTGSELWKLDLGPPPPPPLPAVVTDTDGDTYSVKLSGPGRMQVTLDDPDHDGKGPIAAIHLAGTDRALSSLAVTVLRRSTTTVDNGTVSIGQITGTGLRAITAPKSPLVGTGINLNGFLGSLTIGGLQNQADVISTGSPPTLRSTLTLGPVGDGSDVRLDNAIATLRATGFGNGAIVTPSIGTLAVTGNLAADVTLSGAGVTAAQATLSVLSVTGAIQASSNIQLTGRVGSVTAAGFHGTLTANSAGTLTIRGDLTGDITLTGAGLIAGQMALTTLGVTGNVLAGADVQVTGPISGVNATGFHGTLTASSVGTLTVRADLTGNIAVSGTGVAANRSALAALRVTGNVQGSDIRVGGNVGLVSAAGFKDSTLFAGYTGPANGSGTFNTVAKVGTFSVTGKTNAFANSHLIATTFGVVSLRSVMTDNDPNGVFGLVADLSLGQVTAVTPAFKYKAADPLPQGIDDFQLRIV